MTSETPPVRRGRMSPAVRAFIAVDIVLVLVFLIVLLVTKVGGGGADTPAAQSPPSYTGAASDGGGTESDPGDTGASDDDVESDEAQLFASPSGNILCSISPETASCSIAELADEGYVEDDSCDGTVGHIVRVTGEGAERPCVTGKPPRKAPKATPTLEYESSTSAFGYTCTSSRSGIICRHDGTGHGFSIARAGSSLF